MSSLIDFYLIFIKRSILTQAYDYAYVSVSVILYMIALVMVSVHSGKTLTKTGGNAQSHLGWLAELGGVGIVAARTWSTSYVHL